jgi:hypothetical protein
VPRLPGWVRHSFVVGRDINGAAADSAATTHSKEEAEVSIVSNCSDSQDSPISSVFSGGKQVTLPPWPPTTASSMSSALCGVVRSAAPRLQRHALSHGCLLRTYSITTARSYISRTAAVSSSSFSSLLQSACKRRPPIFRLFSSLLDPTTNEMVTVNTTDRLAALRKLMGQEKIDVYSAHLEFC